MLYQIEGIQTRKRKRVIVYILILLFVLLASIGLGMFAAKQVKQGNKSYENLDDMSSIKNETQQFKEEKVEIERVSTDIDVSKFIANVENIYNGMEGKRVFLTFDDGPSKAVTPHILDTLKENNIKATFFLLGSRVKLNPDLVKREYDEGHYIANHGYSHQYSSIYSSVQSVIDEYNKTDIAIKNALGNPNYNTLLFRFPGGSSGGPYDSLKRQAKGTLESMGIASTNWNCLNGDAEAVGRTKEELVKRLYETASEWDSLVVLMHDADDKQTTVDALPEIIEHYLAEGYTFKNYYDIFK